MNEDDNEEIVVDLNGKPQEDEPEEQPTQPEEPEESVQEPEFTEEELEESERIREEVKKEVEDDKLREKRKELLAKIEKELDTPTDFSGLKFSELPYDTQKAIQKKIDQINMEIRQKTDAINKELAARKAKIEHNLLSIDAWMNNPNVKESMLKFIEILKLLAVSKDNSVEWTIQIRKKTSSDGKTYTFEMLIGKSKI